MIVLDLTLGGKMPSFLGQSGRHWSFDPNQALGPRGGYGEVFLGTDGRSECAVKRVAMRIGDSRERQRRQREIEIASKLSRKIAPHVLAPIDWGMIGDDLLLVMPRAERSLADAILAGDLSTAGRLAALHDVAAGLAELDAAGILHRDLKPANVLRLQGGWRLSDFGNSRDLEASTAAYTFNGTGTVPYMAPEIWQERPATARTDLYALGVLAYEVINGSLPFRGPKVEDFERQHLQETPPPLEIKDGRISRLVIRLLSKQPSARPQDARSVIEVLDAAQRRLDSSQEAIAAAAATMTESLFRREAAQSEQSRLLQLGQDAVNDLAAFLADFADDMMDVFPGAAFRTQDDWFWIHLDAMDVAIAPIRELNHISQGPGIEPYSVLVGLAGSVEEVMPVLAALPPQSRMYWLAERSGMACAANLVCDLVGERLTWSIATFTMRMSGGTPMGAPRGNVLGLRAESNDGGGFHACHSMPLNTESMNWLVRHGFQVLSQNHR